MITKTVTNGERTAQATISEEARFIFSDKWNFFHVQNLGTGTVYIGMSVGVTAGNDGVIAIPSGGTACTMHNFPADSVYVLSTASDLVQVVGSNSAFPPFKLSGSGGGGSAYILPKATAVTLGGIQAKAKTTENAEAAIGADNKLYVTVPLALSELSNDENFIKNTVGNLVNYYTKTDTYTKAEINTIVGNLNVLTTTIVTALPTENISTSTIYLIQTEGTSNYVQWMYINSAWANLGSTEINLTNYYTKLETYSKTETDSLLSQKVDSEDGKGLSANDFTAILKNKLDGISEGANNYTLPAATTSTLGGVKVDGTSVTITDGVISAPSGGGSYTLPIAATDTLGGIKPDGTTITVNNETGVASAAGSSYSLPAASAETLGGVKVGTGLSVTAEGVLSASGGGGITETLLFDGAANTTDVYTLSAAYTGFKFLIIRNPISAAAMWNGIVNCADVQATSDYSMGNNIMLVSSYRILFNTNGINFKITITSSSFKIYGVN